MPSPAVQFDEVIEAGADWEMVVYDRDQDGEAGLPTDLTGCTAELRVWEIGNPPELRVTLTTETGGGITLDGPAGSLICRMTAAQTATLRRDGYYRLKVTWPSGEVNWLLRGRLGVISEVPGV